jgi:outer membrane protein assembly factor BamA
MKEPTWLVRGLIALLLLSATPSLRAGEASSESNAEEEASGQEAAPPGETTRAEILRNKREQKSQELTPYKVSSWEARLRGWEKAKFPQNWLIKGWHGFRPVFGGMPSGSGTVFGGGYIHGLGAQYFQFQANARFSTKGYTMFDGEAVFPPPQAGRRIEFKFRAQSRNLKALSFYGLGNDSSVDNETSFQLEDTLLGGYAWLNPRGLLSFGAQAGFYRAETESGSDSPSVEEVFPPFEIPGFRVPQTDYSVVGGWAEFDLRDKWEDPAVGLVARVTALRYDDIDLNLFGFTRYVADLKGYIPLGPKSRILALRFRTSQSTADSGDVVPFYLMETLGGAKTIRGYNEFRFRDTRNLLVNVEYRWEVWPFADFTLFFDAGKVFFDEDDFNFRNMHTGYGFGIRAHVPGGMALRFDFANSTEGFKIHISGGPTF